MTPIGESPPPDSPVRHLPCENEFLPGRPAWCGAQVAPSRVGAPVCAACFDRMTQVVGGQLATLAAAVQAVARSAGCDLAAHQDLVNPSGDFYTLVENGVVQNEPMLPVLDLDVSNDMWPDSATVDEMEAKIELASRLGLDSAVKRLRWAVASLDPVYEVETPTATRRWRADSRDQARRQHQAAFGDGGAERVTSVRAVSIRQGKHPPGLVADV
ncbi:MAG: hypothetical protein LBG60_04935 [Bifidobacteriaceae bacterium]|jgi:hypothetical protein|nr:hypothetical protein [Bifidobacteriaceae bacterium]